MDLSTPISRAGRRYTLFARKLEKLGILRLEDFLFHIPNRYEDYRIISPIDRIQEGETVTIQGRVNEIKNDYTRGRFRIQRAKVEDKTSEVECIWFNQPYITRIIKKNDFVSLAGKVERSGSKKTILVKDYEVLADESAKPVHTGRLVPVYPETRGLTSKFLRNRLKEIMLDDKFSMDEYLPEPILLKHDFETLTDAFFKVHFPKNIEETKKAIMRLAFDELFLTQLSASYRRKLWEKQQVAHVFSITKFKKEIDKLRENLPFELTGAQTKATRDIFSDLATNKPMNRLLQGDVGSGKTVVAASAMYVAYLNGFQSTLMAPTEILARQHFETIHQLLSPLNVSVELVTGSKKIKNENSKFEILIGTHALLQKNIQFDRLGLVVIDEQQRFGVEQRSILREKGVNPHFLTMTATPIPRTIFLTLYGDLDLSYLNEMPKGRQIVKTWLVPEEKRLAGYEWIKKQIGTVDLSGNKNQVFIICPFIEESESMNTVKAAVKEYEHLKKDVFSDFKVGLLHGKLKASEKTQVLSDFASQKIDILVATPVVEVGIDIPNATIMVIEAAERFGLAQLHQLRGRVGRSDKQSYCLLFTESRGERTLERLRSLEKTHVGAELAEIDLRMRGPGEVYGTMQHGMPSLKIASFSDFNLIEKTRYEADKILPQIEEFPQLFKKIKTYKAESVSPD